MKSPSLAVVDGTHLCLVPTPSSTDETQDSRRESRNDTDHHDAPPLLRVAGLPMWSVRRFCGGRHAPCSGFGGRTSALVEGTVPASDDEGRSAFETVEISLADVASADRFLAASTSLANTVDGPPLSVRVRCGPDGDGVLDLCEGGTHVELNLPSSSTSSSGCGDSHVIVFGDESLAAELGRRQETDVPPSPHTTIHGAGSCLVGDFVGLGSQALFLPMVSSDLLSKATFGGDLQEQRLLLESILENSILTDGLSALIPDRVELEGDGNASTSFTLPPLMDASNQKPNAGVSSEMQVEDEMVAGSDSKEEGSPQEDPPWLKEIAKTVDYRKTQQAKDLEQRRVLNEAKRNLVQNGRMTLDASGGARRGRSANVPGQGTKNQLQIIRLRYGTRPRLASQIGAGVSVVLDLEVDLICRRTRSGDDSMPIADVHLSCFLAQKGASSAKVDTESGVCSLHPGDCVTFLAKVHLSNLSLDVNPRNFEVAIQGNWTNSRDPENSDCTDDELEGSVLGILSIPEESLLSSAQVDSKSRSGHWIQHEVDFTAPSSEDRLLFPSAVIDYRNPRTITIDTSRSGFGVVQDAKKWQDLVSGKSNSHFTVACINLIC